MFPSTEQKPLSSSQSIDTGSLLQIVDSTENLFHK